MLKNKKNFHHVVRKLEFVEVETDFKMIYNYKITPNFFLSAYIVNLILKKPNRNLFSIKKFWNLNIQNSCNLSAVFKFKFLIKKMNFMYERDCVSVRENASSIFAIGMMT